VLVVGKTKDFDKPLSTLGPVKEIDIAIPPPPGAKGQEDEKPAASNEEGMALAAKVVAALGGESKLSAIKSMKEQLTITQKTPQGEFPMQMDTILVFPDQLHAAMQTPNGTMDIVVTPNEAFAALPGGKTQTLPEAQKSETLEQIKRDPTFIGSHWKDPNVFFHANGTEKIGDIEARIVDVNAAGAAIRWFVDPQSGRILKETYRTLSQGRPVDGETDMDNWKPIAGLTLPLTRHNKQNGEETSMAEIKSLELNPAVDPKLFAKPPQQPETKP
jgi:hypothetical protein